MDEPGGTPGSGWDVRLDLSGVAGTPAAPSPAGGSAFGGTPGDAALPGGKRGERPRRTSPESPLLAGADASSSSSGSPNENDRARSNPPSPRGASPRGASPRGDALERGAPDDAPSDAASAPPAATGEARRVTPLEQRRRDALEAKQRRLDGIMSRVAAARAPRDEDARDGTSGEPREWNVGGPDAAATPSASSSSAPSDPPEPGSVESPAAEREPPREPREEAEAYSASPALSSEVSEDWDDFLVDVTPPTRPPPPTPAKRVPDVPDVPAETGTGTGTGTGDRDGDRVRDRDGDGRGDGEVTPVTPRDASPSERSERRFATPGLGLGLDASLVASSPPPLGGSREGVGSPLQTFATPESPPTPRGASPSFARGRSRLGAAATGADDPSSSSRGGGGGSPAAGRNENDNDASAERARVRARSARPLTDGAASFMARLGAARRQVKGEGAGGGREEAGAGGGRRRTDEGDGDGEGEGEGDVGNRHVRSWLSDSAEAAAAFSLARRPPRSPAPARAEAPGTPGTPGTPRGRRDSPGIVPAGMASSPGTPADPRRGASLDKAAAARRIMRAAASPVARAGTPVRPSASGSMGPAAAASDRSAARSSERKRDAARRIMLAAAAKKASAGVGGSPAGAATSLGGDDSFDAADALFSPMRRGGDASERSELASAIAPKPTAARGLVLEDLEAVREGFPPGNDSEAPSGVLRTLEDERAPPEGERALAPPSVLSPPSPLLTPPGAGGAPASSPPRPASPTYDGEPPSDGGAFAFAFDASPNPSREGSKQRSERVAKSIAVVSDTENETEAETEAPLARGTSARPPPNAVSYDTDGGYQTASQGEGLGFAAVDFSDVASLRSALEHAELRLEEKEWEREALAARVAEAERARARDVSSATETQLGRLREEVDRNAYLRRLLKRAEQTRGAARTREKEARARAVALEREFQTHRQGAERDLQRADEELAGLRRRVGAERARGQALEARLEETEREFAEHRERSASTRRALGVALAVVLALCLRVWLGPRVAPEATRTTTRFPHSRYGHMDVPGGRGGLGGVGFGPG